jgi:hypothetical protein
MKHWFSDLYANVDAMRLDKFVAGLAPDVEVVVGNNPAMHGRQAAKDGIAYFWSTINGIKHHFLNVAESKRPHVLGSECRVPAQRRQVRQHSCGHCAGATR